jgi:DNA polymerase
MQNEAKKTLADLINDVRDQAVFMEELGVSSLDARLPVYESVSVDEEAPILAPSGPPDDLLIPMSPPQPMAEPVKAVPRPVAETRRSLLESTRLSTFAADVQKNPTVPVSNIKTDQVQNIVLKKTMAVEEHKDTMFGDITKALPESNETIEQIRADIGDCRRCGLCEGRTNIAHSQGNLNADLMFIGEAPGADEDAQAAPFVGRAGQLLTKIIEAIDIKREDVFIGNINRCRPPQNRAPLPDEVAACKPFLLREIAVVRPKAIVVLGNTALQNLLETKIGITRLRGNFQDYYGIKVMPTFHPAYLLRDPRKKREVWEDIKMVRDYLTKQG